MLALRCVRRQHIVVEEQTVQHHAGNADAAIDDDPKGQHRQAGPAGDDPATGFKPENERIEDEGRRDDDTGLETAARAVISVKLDIETEHDDRGEQDLGADAQYRIVTHRRHPFSAFVGTRSGGTRRPGRAGKQNQDTEPGGEHDDRLAEGIEPAVAGQHGGHDIRDVEEGPAFLEITRRHMNMRRRQRVADRRQFDGGQDQQRAGKATDHKCRKDVPHPLRLRRCLLGAREIGHRGEEQHRRDPAPTAASVKATSTASRLTNIAAETSE